MISKLLNYIYNSVVSREHLLYEVRILFIQITHQIKNQNLSEPSFYNQLVFCLNKLQNTFEQEEVHRRKKINQFETYIGLKLNQILHVKFPNLLNLNELENWIQDIYDMRNDVQIRLKYYFPNISKIFPFSPHKKLQDNLRKPQTLFIQVLKIHEDSKNRLYNEVNKIQTLIQSKNLMQIYQYVEKDNKNQKFFTLLRDHQFFKDLLHIHQRYLLEKVSIERVQEFQSQDYGDLLGGQTELKRIVSSQCVQLMESFEQFCFNKEKQMKKSLTKNQHVSLTIQDYCTNYFLKHNKYIQSDQNQKFMVSEDKISPKNKYLDLNLERNYLKVKTENKDSLKKIQTMHVSPLLRDSLNSQLKSSQNTNRQPNTVSRQKYSFFPIKTQEDESLISLEKNQSCQTLKKKIFQFTTNIQNQFYELYPNKILDQPKNLDKTKNLQSLKLNEIIQKNSKSKIPDNIQINPSKSPQESEKYTFNRELYVLPQCKKGYNFILGKSRNLQENHSQSVETLQIRQIKYQESELPYPYLYDVPKKNSIFSIECSSNLNFKSQNFEDRNIWDPKNKDNRNLIIDACINKEKMNQKERRSRKSLLIDKKLYSDIFEPIKNIALKQLQQIQINNNDFKVFQQGSKYNNSVHNNNNNALFSSQQ